MSIETGSNNFLNSNVLQSKPKNDQIGGPSKNNNVLKTPEDKDSNDKKDKKTETKSSQDSLVLSQDAENLIASTVASSTNDAEPADRVTQVIKDLTSREPSAILQLNKDSIQAINTAENKNIPVPEDVVKGILDKQVVDAQTLRIAQDAYNQLAVQPKSSDSNIVV
jgi:hypothetical protein